MPLEIRYLGARGKGVCMWNILHHMSFLRGLAVMLLAMFLSLVKKPEITPGAFYAVTFFLRCCPEVSMLETRPASREPPSEVPSRCQTFGLAWERQSLVSWLLFLWLPVWVLMLKILFCYCLHFLLSVLHAYIYMYIIGSLFTLVK